MLPAVAIITSTYNRDFKTLEQCIKSVQWQTYKNIIHIICHDGPWPQHPPLKEDWKGLITNTPERTNSYGAGVRQFVLDTFIKNLPHIKYIHHLDDDNIIFPRFIEEHVFALENAPDVDFTICKIVHNGPLPEKLGKPPQILSGVPPVLQNIDTLQVVVRAKAMIELGWVCLTGKQGYVNDGLTYQKLGEKYKWKELPILLGIHI